MSGCLVPVTEDLSNLKHLVSNIYQSITRGLQTLTILRVYAGLRRICMSDKVEKIRDFLVNLEAFDADQLMILVEKHLNDECIEALVEHIEEFYGIHEDEELGMLAQLMVTGYLIAKNESGNVLAPQSSNLS